MINAILIAVFAYFGACFIAECIRHHRNANPGAKWLGIFDVF
jgi:hypothetical protein